MIACDWAAAHLNLVLLKKVLQQAAIQSLPLLAWKQVSCECAAYRKCCLLKQVLVLFDISINIDRARRLAQGKQASE